nr:MAG TPA: hypothetical protein [Caudoviricetes sp.]DAT31973.1 MAG TPA: hypothetical protein [Caudoviricetes sp.]
MTSEVAVRGNINSLRSSLVFTGFFPVLFVLVGVKLGSKILLQSKSRGKNWQVILFNLVLS